MAQFESGNSVHRVKSNLEQGDRMMIFKDHVAQAAYNRLSPGEQGLLRPPTEKLEQIFHAGLANPKGIHGIDEVLDSFGIERFVEVRKGQDAEAQKQFRAYHDFLLNGFLLPKEEAA